MRIINQINLKPREQIIKFLKRQINSNIHDEQVKDTFRNILDYIYCVPLKDWYSTLRPKEEVLQQDKEIVKLVKDFALS